MANKFVTLNHHCADSATEPYGNWEYSEKYYIELLLRKNFPHASLSMGPFTAYMWRYGNTEWLGNFNGIGTTNIQLHHEYLRRGGGLVFYEHPGVVPAGYQFNPGVEFGASFEEIINSKCRRFTERIHPFTGEFEDMSDGRSYALDAVHDYFGDLGEDGKIKAVVNAESLMDWWAYYLCGVERGEYAGPSPMSPVFQKTNWLDVYDSDFQATPFYWVAGLQSLINAKMFRNEEINHLQIIFADESQRLWCSMTPAEKAAFVLDWLCVNGDVAPYSIGTYFMSKGQYWQKDLYPISESDISINKRWRNFEIPQTIVPRPAAAYPEAKLTPAMISGDDGRHGLNCQLYEDLIDFLIDYQKTHPEVIYCSDRETKDMVVQQYHDALPIVDHERILLIAQYLSNTLNWNENDEWDSGYTVTRPPNYARIEVSEGEYEYYTLAESWWIMLHALYLIATNEGLTEIPSFKIHPVIGPHDPVVPTLKNGPGLPPDNYLRINVWWQNDASAGKYIKFSEIKKQVRQLYLEAWTKPIGPRYRERQVVIPKVVTFWPFAEEGSSTVQANAAESLYIMAKALMNWDAATPPAEPAMVEFYPSHVCPILVYTFAMNGVLIDHLSQAQTMNAQTGWLEVGQFWTFKPAVLKPEYRS